MNKVLQTGQVTPGHLAAWNTDGVVQDAGVTFTNTYGKFVSTVQQVNFNASNSDTQIPINLPVGYTRYRLEQILISGASGTLSTATCSVYTGAGGSGVNIVSSGTAVTITSAAADSSNNMQSLTIANQNTIAFSDPTLYFRVQNAQGVAATGNVSVFYQLMP